MRVRIAEPRPEVVPAPASPDLLPMELVRELEAIGAAAGLDAVGVAHPAPFARTRSELEQRREQGLDGGMQFTYRNPARSTDVSVSVPWVRAIVVAARSYRRPTPDRPEDGGPVARVGRYAWVDHYADLRVGLEALAERLRADGHEARVVADDNRLVDREAAFRAGLGRYGKNANLLLPGRGSWFVLGSVVTSAPLPPTPADLPDPCGTCERCIDACPTGAIVAPGVVDARRCLAWLVQAPGDIPRRHRVALADRIYGCDDCQEVCPPNRRADRPPGDERAVGTPASGAVEPEAWVAVEWLLTAPDEDLLARHGRWYIPQRDPDHLRRNALVVLGNTADPGDPRAVHLLTTYLAHPRPLLRAHAAWAARRLGRDDLLAALAHDPDPEVQAELSAPAPAVRGGG